MKLLTNKGTSDKSTSDKRKEVKYESYKNYYRFNVWS